MTECPYCQSRVVSKIEAPYPSEDRIEVMEIEQYKCMVCKREFEITITDKGKTR